MPIIAPSVTDQMTTLYTFVDDYLKAHPTQAQWRRSQNNALAFTDAEVITIGLMQGVFGCATLKKAYLLIAAGWRSACPWMAVRPWPTWATAAVVMNSLGHWLRRPRCC
jgi:hypothetical protein